jgi:replicative DNA helicase
MHGKSVLCATLARLHAETFGRRVHVFHLEDTANVLVYRLVTQLSALSVQRVAAIVTRRADGPEASRDADIVRGCLQRIAAWPISVDDTPALRIDSLRIRAREKAREGVELFLFDHALEFGRPSHLSEYDALNKIIRGCRDTCLETAVPGILFAQVRRPDGTKVTRPRLAQLKGTGSFEEVARLVGLLWRPEAENKRRVDHPHPIWIDIAKSSNGETGSACLMFDGSRMLIRQPTPAELVLARRCEDSGADFGALWRDAYNRPVDSWPDIIPPPAEVPF